MIKTEEKQKLFLRKKLEGSHTTVSQGRKKEEIRPWEANVLEYLKQTGIFNEFMNVAREMCSVLPEDMDRYFIMFQRNARKKYLSKGYQHQVAKEHGVAFKEVRFRVYKGVMEIRAGQLIKAYIAAGAIDIMRAPSASKETRVYKNAGGCYSNGAFSMALNGRNRQVSLKD